MLLTTTEVSELVKATIRAMMLEDILTQGERVAAQLPAIEAQAEAVWGEADPKALSRIFIVGCGDSYYAGLAARHALHAWTGLWAEPVEALEFRYLSDSLPKGSLVIGISVSGQVERTLDCLTRARECGHLTVGVTGTQGSRIHQVAAHVIDAGIRVREPGPVPQTAHFLANVTALLTLARTLGSRRGALTAAEAESHRQAMLRALGLVRQTAERNQAQVMAYALRSKDLLPWVFVGGGPHWATAHFGVAKFLEAALVPAIFQELEEWAHEQYFLTGPNLPTVVIGAEGPIWDRVGPTANAVTAVGGPLILVVPEGLMTAPDGAALWEYPSGLPEPITPMLAKVPVELLAYAVAEHLDRRPFNYGSDVRKRTVERTIYHGGVSAESVNRREGRQ